MSPENATSTFTSLGLSAKSLRSLERAGFTRPTPIQAQAIPHALTGVDLIGCAATGTGKTAAFVLPLVERLAGKKGTRALILAPTRELATQIAEQVQWIGSTHDLQHATLIGGVGMGAQVKAVRAGAQILIATPGRLIDHLEQGSVKLDTIEALVLDEADRMLDMGFKPQLTRILQKLPRKRQTLLFSATMGGEVGNFAKAHLHEPVRVEVTRSGVTAARATQCVYKATQLEKTALLLALLEESEDSTLVFTRTKRRADKVAKSLEREGYSVSRIHADRSQSQRQQALEGFRNGKYRVLVATDIAARGIDVAEIGHVVNYDLPHVPEDYVHRIGRTARASASGRASSFCSPEEAPLLREIERFTKSLVPQAQVPRDSAIFQKMVKLASERQAHPGPPQRSHGVSGRAPGQAPGRHARSHQKRHAGGSRDGAATSSAPRQEGAAAGTHRTASRSEGGASGRGTVVFSGSPRRRR